MKKPLLILIILILICFSVQAATFTQAQLDNLTPAQLSAALPTSQGSIFSTDGNWIISPYNYTIIKKGGRGYITEPKGGIYRISVKNLNNCSAKRTDAKCKSLVLIGYSNRISSMQNIEITRATNWKTKIVPVIESRSTLSILLDLIFSRIGVGLQ